MLMNLGGGVKVGGEGMRREERGAQMDAMVTDRQTIAEQ